MHWLKLYLAGNGGHPFGLKIKETLNVGQNGPQLLALRLLLQACSHSSLRNIFLHQFCFGDQLFSTIKMHCFINMCPCAGLQQWFVSRVSELNPACLSGTMLPHAAVWLMAKIPWPIFLHSGLHFISHIYKQIHLWIHEACWFEYFCFPFMSSSFISTGSLWKRNLWLL